MKGLVVVVGFALALGGCQLPGSDSANNLGGAVGTIIGVLPTSVQAKVKQICGWEEPLGTIAQILATFKPGQFSSTTALVLAAATGMCKTVQAPANNGLGLLDAARAPVYRGVALVGGFAR